MALHSFQRPSVFCPYHLFRCCWFRLSWWVNSINVLLFAWWLFFFTPKLALSVRWVLVCYLCVVHLRWSCWVFSLSFKALCVALVGVLLPYYILISMSDSSLFVVLVLYPFGRHINNKPTTKLQRKPTAEQTKQPSSKQKHDWWSQPILKNKGLKVVGNYTKPQIWGRETHILTSLEQNV